MIRSRLKAALLQPGGDAARVLYRERINDSTAGQFRQVTGQPGQSLGLVVETNVKKLE